MTSNDLEPRNLETLDRDLGRLSNLEMATAYVSKPMVGPGIALTFIVLASLLALIFFGESSNTFVVVVAAGFGAYMAINIGANDVANNMGPAVGGKVLTVFAAIAIATASMI